MSPKPFIALSTLFALGLLLLAASPHATTAVIPDAPERIRASCLAALVGDALALFSQGEYQPDRIRSAIGRISNFQAPIKLADGRERLGVNHGKKAGNLTEVGSDIALVLKACAAQTESGSVESFSIDALVRAIYQHHKLDAPGNLESGMLAAATRFIPLLGVVSDETQLATYARQLVDATHKHEDPRDAAEFLARVAYRIIHSRQSPVDALIAVARFMFKQHQEARNERLRKSSTAITGNNNVDDDYDDGAVRLTRWLGAARNAALKAKAAAELGVSFDEAGATDEEIADGSVIVGRSASDPAFIDEDALTFLVRKENNFVVDHIMHSSDTSEPFKEEEKFKDSMLDEHSRRAREARHRHRPLKPIHPRALLMLSKSGATETALPASLYLILRHGDLEEALIANAMLGGDAASRAVVIGLVLGAHQGIDAIPGRWISSLSDLDAVGSALSKLPLVSQLARHSEL